VILKVLLRIVFLGIILLVVKQIVWSALMVFIVR
jgi:hypothetical protein